MSWNIAEAKQKFSEVVRLTAEEPQVIYNRGRPVAAVVDAETFRQFEEWRTQKAPKTLADAFAEVRALAEGDEDPIPLSPRRDRANAFLEVLDEYPD